MEYRINHAIQLCKKEEKEIYNDNADRSDNESQGEEEDDNDDGIPEACQ